MLLYDHLSIDEISPDLSSGGDTVILSSISLNDGLSANLVSYAPTVAPRRAATISGGGTYAEVEDAITVTIVGDTPALCGATLVKLIGLIIQGGRWFAGETVNPVQVRARVQSSAFSSDLMALVLGPAGEQAPVTVDPQFDVTIDRWVIQNVELRFLRRGRWLTLGAFAAGDAAGATTNPQILSFSLAGQGAFVLGVDAPASVGAFAPVGTTLGNEIGYLLTSVSSAGLLLADASTATAAGYTTVANAAAFPFQGTNILRYTPTGTSFAASGTILSNQVTSNYQVWAVYAAVRKNTAAASFQVRAAITPESSTGVQGPVIRTRPVVVDSSDVDPQILPVGIFAINATRFDLALEIAASTISGPPTFDISYLCLQALDAPGARATRIEPNSAAAPAGRFVVNAERLNLRAGEVRPISALSFSAYAVATTYDGDTDMVVPGVGEVNVTPTLAAVYLETQGAAWTVNSGAAKRAVGINLSARGAALFPR